MMNNLSQEYTHIHTHPQLQSSLQVKDSTAAAADEIEPSDSEQGDGC